MIVYVCATLFSIIFAAFSAKQLAVRSIQYGYGGSKYIKVSNKDFSNEFSTFVFAFLSFLPLFFVSAFRYNVGKDYEGTYRIGFEAIASGGDVKNFEIGFKLINRFVLFFTKDYAGLFIVTAFLFCFFVYKAIYSQSVNPAFSIFLLVTSGFYFYSMNAVRQCIVISIFFYAIRYINEKNFKKYLFWILLASTIHLIALIYIPVYFIGKIRLSVTKTFVFLGASAIILPFLQKFIYYLIGFTKYSVYINSIYDTSEKGYIMPLINLAIILLAYYYKSIGKKDKDWDDTSYTLLLNIQIIAAFFSLCLGLFPLASRLFFSFFYNQIFLIPLIITQEKKQNVRLILEFITVVLYSVYFIYTVGIQNSNTVLPYQTIFDR